MANRQIYQLTADTTPARTDIIAKQIAGGSTEAEGSTIAQLLALAQAGDSSYTASGGTARTVESKLGEVVSVKDYGAKGDGRFLTGMSSTASSSTFTATGGVTAGDTGKRFSMPAANGGRGFGGTVTYATSTTFTASSTSTGAAPVSSQSNKIGIIGTNDTTAIQAALDAVSTAGGGTVFFPRGMYVISAVINVPVNVRLLGDALPSFYSSYDFPGSDRIAGGIGSMIVGTAAATMFKLPTAMTKYQHLSIVGLTIDGSDLATTGVDLDCTSGSSAERHVFIRDCQITGINGKGLVIMNTITHVIQNNMITACRDWGVFCQYSASDCLFTDNYVRLNYGGVYFGEGCYFVTITGGKIEDNYYGTGSLGFEPRGGLHCNDANHNGTFQCVVAVNGVSFQHNSGPGVVSDSAVLTITNAQFEWNGDQNYAGGGPAAQYVHGVCRGAGRLNIANSTVRKNSGQTGTESGWRTETSGQIRSDNVHYIHEPAGGRWLSDGTGALYETTVPFTEVRNASFTLGRSHANLITVTSASTITIPAVALLGEGFQRRVHADGIAVTLDGPGGTNVSMVSGDVATISVSNNKTFVFKVAGTIVS